MQPLDGCVLVLFTGADDGATAALAQHVAEGAAACPGAQVVVAKAVDASAETVRRAGAVVFGTGDFGGQPEPQLFAFVDPELGARARAKLLDGKVAAGFCAAAGSGQRVLEGLVRAATAMGAVFVGGSGSENALGVVGTLREAEAGGAAWAWANPGAAEAQARDLGRRVAKVARFCPGPYAEDEGEASEGEEEQSGTMTLYWLCFWIALGLVAVLVFQRR